MEVNLLNLQNFLRNYGVLISFSGRFTQGIIEELGDAVKKYLETEAIPQRETYNVFSIFIEQTQNIKNYSTLKIKSPAGERIANSGIVAIGKDAEQYFVMSGNLVENQDVAALTATVTRILALDKEGLKKQYKAQIREALSPGSRGAGLGLINMARKAGRPLNYSLEPVDEQVSFFTLQAWV